MSKGYPQVGDLVKDGRTLGVITGIGQFRGGDGEPTWGLLIDGKDWGGVEWGQSEGYVRGGEVELRSHLVWNDKGYWEQKISQGQCPVLEHWQAVKMAEVFREDDKRFVGGCDD